MENSGAFTFDSTTGNYTMNNNDGFTGGQVGCGCYLWTDTVYNVQRGYCLALSPQISQQELNSSTFDNQDFQVNKFWGSGGAAGQSQENTYFTLTKMQFFDLWLGLKLQPESYGGNPSDPSGITGLDSLASNFATLLSEPQNYIQNGGTTAQDISAQVQGREPTATSYGFPTAEGVLEQLADFVNGIINAFIGAITAIWNAIVAVFTTVADFVMAVWNNVVGPVVGAAIEEVKNVVTILLNQILNTVTQPMLTGQTTSLDALFGGVSPSTVVANAQSPVSAIGTSLDSQSSQLSSVGSSMQSMMSSLSVFNGAGTILGPLIEMTGPGIMSTLRRY